MLTEQEKGIKETVQYYKKRGTEITSYFTIECFNNIELKICLTKLINKRIPIYCFSSKCISSCS